MSSELTSRGDSIAYASFSPALTSIMEDVGFLILLGPWLDVWVGLAY